MPPKPSRIAPACDIKGTDTPVRSYVGRIASAGCYSPPRSRKPDVGRRGDSLRHCCKHSLGVPPAGIAPHSVRVLHATTRGESRPQLQPAEIAAAVRRGAIRKDTIRKDTIRKDAIRKDAIRNVRRPSKERRTRQCR